MSALEKCPRCGATAPVIQNGHCGGCGWSRRLASNIKSVNEAQERPDCDICGRPYHSHVEIAGAGRMCPVSAVSYRPKMPKAALKPALDERAKVLEEAASVADNWNSTRLDRATETNIAAAIRALSAIGGVN